MIEILAIIYCSSLGLSSLLLLWNLNSLQSQLRSKELTQLNLNLRHVNLFWSLTDDNLKSLNESSIQKDAQAARRSCLMMGLLGLASLPGLLLYLVLTLSLSFVQSRRKKYIFKSELVKSSNLNAHQIKEILEQFKSQF